MKQNRFLLPILLFLAALFVAISGFVVYNVHNLQKELRENVSVITFASEVEQKTYRLLSDFNFYEINSTNQSVEQLAKTSLPKAKEFGLKSIENRLTSLEKNAHVNISGHKTKAIQEGLFQLEGKCKAIVRQNRINTSITSIALKRYWKFTYWLIGASCFLAILLSYTAYKVFRAKEKIEGLTKIKTLLLDSSIDVVVTCDQKGRIVEFNRAAEKQFGYTIDEVRDKKVEFLYANQDQAQAVKEGINLNESFTGEILNRKKNGEIFVSQISANRVLNEAGKTVGSMGVSRDITKQKELETNFESIVNNVADIVYSTDIQGNFTFVNKAVTEILGYKAEELVGKLFTSIIHDDHKARVLEKYTNQFMKREDVTYASFQARCKDGSYVWISQSVRIVMSETHKGHIVGVHGIARNVEGLKEVPTEKYD